MGGHAAVAHRESLSLRIPASACLKMHVGLGLRGLSGVRLLVDVPACALSVLRRIHVSLGLQALSDVRVIVGVHACVSAFTITNKHGCTCMSIFSIATHHGCTCMSIVCTATHRGCTCMCICPGGACATHRWCPVGFFPVVIGMRHILKRSPKSFRTQLNATWSVFSGMGPRCSAPCTCKCIVV